MMLKVVIVALAILVLLEQASGQGEININVGGTGGGDTPDNRQYAAIAELLGKGGGLFQDKTDTAPLETLDMTDIGQDMINTLLLGQIKDLQSQVKKLTLDVCLTKKTCCNKTLTCPSGYERFCERPDMCYKFSTDEKNYTDARSDCKADGGYLAMPKDQATNDFLVNQIKTRYTSTGPAPIVWMGLKDEVTEGTWVWEDGTQLSTGWSNWYPGHPDPKNPLHNCAIWLPHIHKWLDVLCGVLVRQYICEVKATAAP